MRFIGRAVLMLLFAVLTLGVNLQVVSQEGPLKPLSKIEGVDWFGLEWYCGEPMAYSAQCGYSSGTCVVPSKDGASVRHIYLYWTALYVNGVAPSSVANVTFGHGRKTLQGVQLGDSEIPVSDRYPWNRARSFRAVVHSDIHPFNEQLSLRGAAGTWTMNFPGTNGRLLGATLFFVYRNSDESKNKQLAIADGHELIVGTPGSDNGVTSLSGQEIGIAKAGNICLMEKVTSESLFIFGGYEGGDWNNLATLSGSYEIKVNGIPLGTQFVRPRGFHHGYYTWSDTALDESLGYGWTNIESTIRLLPAGDGGWDGGGGGHELATTGSLDPRWCIWTTYVFSYTAEDALFRPTCLFLQGDSSLTTGSEEYYTASAYYYYAPDEDCFPRAAGRAQGRFKFSPADTESAKWCDIITTEDNSRIKLKVKKNAPVETWDSTGNADIPDYGYYVLKVEFTPAEEETGAVPTDWSFWIPIQSVRTYRVCVRYIGARDNTDWQETFRLINGLWKEAGVKFRYVDVSGNPAADIMKEDHPEWFPKVEGGEHDGMEVFDPAVGLSALEDRQADFPDMINLFVVDSKIVLLDCYGYVDFSSIGCCRGQEMYVAIERFQPGSEAANERYFIVAHELGHYVGDLKDLIGWISDREYRVYLKSSSCHTPCDPLYKPMERLFLMGGGLPANLRVVSSWESDLMWLVGWFRPSILTSKGEH